MFRAIVVACLAVACLAAPYTYDVELDPYWESYKTTYNKQYGMLGEEPMR